MSGRSARRSTGTRGASIGCAFRSVARPCMRTWARLSTTPMEDTLPAPRTTATPGASAHADGRIEKSARGHALAKHDLGVEALEGDPVEQARRRHDGNHRPAARLRPRSSGRIRDAARRQGVEDSGDELQSARTTPARE